MPSNHVSNEPYHEWLEEVNKHKSGVLQNHMFDVAFTLVSPKDWEDITNGELITALAKRLDALREEYRFTRDKPHDDAFGYSDSYVVLDQEETKQQ